MFCDLKERVEQKIAHFLAGLNMSITEKVDLQCYWSFEEVCEVALRVEKHAKANKSTYGKSYNKKIKSTGNMVQISVNPLPNLTSS